MSGESEWLAVGERIRQARLGAGLSQDALGSRVGLDRTMIAKVEAGVRRIDALELIRLSAALGVPVDHLIHPRPAVLSRRGGLLAEDAQLAAGRQVKRLETALTSWLSDVRQMIDLGLLATPTLLTYPGAVTGEDGAREAAGWVRRELGLDDHPINTLMRVAERCGQYVLVTDLPGDGASLIDAEVAVAVVSTTGDPGRRRATGAHELGHLVLGDEYSTDLGVNASHADREKAIEAFAAELLLPVSAFGALASKTVLTRDDLIGLAARFRTSWSLALRQAEQAGAVNAATRRRLSQATPTRAELMEAVGWAPQPDLEAVRVPPSYSHAVMEAWKRDLVTGTRAVELMHGQITLDDLPSRDYSDLAP